MFFFWRDASLFRRSRYASLHTECAYAKRTYPLITEVVAASFSVYLFDARKAHRPTEPI